MFGRPSQLPLPHHNVLGGGFSLWHPSDWSGAGDFSFEFSSRTSARTCFWDPSVVLLSVHRRVDHIYKIIYSRLQRLFWNARKPLKTLARPAGLEPATPGLEDRSSRLWKREDFDGAVRFLVAIFTARSLKPVES